MVRGVPTRILNLLRYLAGAKRQSTKTVAPGWQTMGVDIHFAPTNLNLLSRRDTYLPGRGNKRGTSVVRNGVFYDLPGFVVETRRGSKNEDPCSGVANNGRRYSLARIEFSDFGVNRIIRVSPH